jgi:hypothetical protein
MVRVYCEKDDEILGRSQPKNLEPGSGTEYRGYWDRVRFVLIKSVVFMGKWSIQ